MLGVSIQVCHNMPCIFEYCDKKIQENLTTENGVFLKIKKHEKAAKA